MEKVVMVMTNKWLVVCVALCILWNVPAAWAVTVAVGGTDRSSVAAAVNHAPGGQTTSNAQTAAPAVKIGD